MIARIKGGNSGIVEYLRFGYKSNSDYTRNELDNRLILTGNLDITQSVIDNIVNKGQERYLHITLSFRENNIDSETLNNVTENYIKFLMSAYHIDEYNCYAEAHIPKIKQIYDKKNNVFVERKPHVHIIIPKQNLITGKTLNPVGIVKQSERELDHIQENINYLFDLQTPKDFLRTENDVYSKILSRFKGDIYVERRGKEKSKLIEKIINNKINTINEFETELKKLGDIKIRNNGKLTQYYAIKFTGDSKFTNLKNPLFSKNFIVNKTLPNVRPTKKETEITLKYWTLIKSKELKYIRPLSKKKRDHYYTLTDSEKIHFLNEVEKKYNHKFNINIDEVNTSDTINFNINYSLSNEEFYLKSFYSNTNNENLASQKINEIIDDNNIDESINYNKIHPKNILEFLEENFLINKNNYKYFRKKNNDFRVKVNNKIFSNCDLLTKHIGLNWNESKIILNNIYNQTQSNISINKNVKEQFKKIIKFRKDISCFRKNSNDIFYSQINGLIEEVKHGKKINFEQEKAIILFRKMQREEIINYFNNYITEEFKNYSKIKEVTRMAIETKTLSENGVISPEPYSINARIEEKKKEVEFYLKNQANLTKNNVGIQKNNDGTIDYKNIESGNTILKDYGYGIFLNRGVDDENSIKLMLDLSISKYGNNLSLTGTKEFKQKTIEIIIKHNLPVIFKDKALQQQLNQRKADMNRRSVEQEIENKERDETINKLDGLKNEFSIKDPEVLFDNIRNSIQEENKERDETINKLDGLKNEFSIKDPEVLFDNIRDSIVVGNKLLSSDDYKLAYHDEFINNGLTEQIANDNINYLERIAEIDNSINNSPQMNPSIIDASIEAKQDYVLMNKGAISLNKIYEKMQSNKEYQTAMMESMVEHAENLQSLGYKIDDVNVYVKEQIDTMKLNYDLSKKKDLVTLNKLQQNSIEVGNKLLSNDDYKLAYHDEFINNGLTEQIANDNINYLERIAEIDNSINNSPQMNPSIIDASIEAKQDYVLMNKGAISLNKIYEKMQSNKEYQTAMMESMVEHAENLQSLGYKIDDVNVYVKEQIDIMKLNYEKTSQQEGVHSLLAKTEKIDVKFKYNEKTGNAECFILGSNLATFNVNDKEILIDGIIRSPQTQEYINQTTKDDLRKGIVNIDIKESVIVSVDSTAFYETKTIETEMEEIER